MIHFQNKYVHGSLANFPNSYRHSRSFPVIEKKLFGVQKTHRCFFAPNKNHRKLFTAEHLLQHSSKTMSQKNTSVFFANKTSFFCEREKLLNNSFVN